MRLFSFVAGVAFVALPVAPALAGYPESPSSACTGGHSKVNNNTWCVDPRVDDGYPESPNMACFGGFYKVANGTYCKRY